MSSAKAMAPSPAGEPNSAGEGEPASRPGRRERPWRQYAQFISVGVANAIVDLAVLNLLYLIWPTTAKLGLTVENSAAVALAIANSYLWNTRYTFRDQADGSGRQLVLFVAQSLLNIAINDIALLVTAGHLRQLDLRPAWLGVNLSKGVAMAFASSVSFLAMRLYVFRSRR